MQNIGAANADDAFYRYKMPKLVAKIEGRGNGIKTNVVNCVDIAKALARPPEYVLKYFGCELGAQINYEAKSGTSIVNGAHDAKKLSELLEGFIKKYVQCYSCGNPETQIKIKRDFIHLKCKACGFVSDVDMRHKLNTFILKNPPENKLSKEEKKLKKAEEERLREAGEAEKREKKEKKEKSKDKEGKDKDGKDKKEKKEKKDKKKKDDDKGDDDNDDTGSASDSDEDDDGVVWMTDTSAEAAKKRAEEQLTAATAAMVTQGNIEAEEEAARKRAEKEAKRKAEEEEEARKAEEERRAAEEAAAAAAAASQQNSSEEADDDVSKIRSLIESGSSAADVAAEVKKLGVAGGLAGKMRVLYEAVLCAPSAKELKLLDAYKARTPLFAAHSKDQPGQLAQLIALEYILAVSLPDRVKEAPLVLKYMYDEDLADEEVILAWAGKADAGKILEVPAEGGKAVRKAAAPVVEWLEEEDESEDDEE